MIQWVRVAGFLVVTRPSIDCRRLFAKCGERVVGLEDVERMCSDVDRALREALVDYGCPVRRVAADLGWGSVYVVDERDKASNGGDCIDVVREVINTRYDVVIIPFVGQVPILVEYG